MNWGSLYRSSVTAIIDFGKARVTNELARAFSRLPKASP